MLGRPGEASGVNFWTYQLTNGGWNRGQVMLGFSEATEYIQRTSTTAPTAPAGCPTQGLPPVVTPPPVTQPPGVPTGVSAAASTTQQQSVTVSWTAPTTGGAATAYRVEYRAAGAPSWTQVTSDTTSQTIAGLTPGTNYEFRVAATNASGTSAFTGPATVNGCTITPFAVGSCGYTTWRTKHEAALRTGLDAVDTLACASASARTTYLNTLNAAIADLPAGDKWRLWLQDAKAAMDANIAACTGRSGWYADVTGFVAGGRTQVLLDSNGAVAATPPAWEDPYHYWWTAFSGSTTVTGASDICESNQLLEIRQWIDNYNTARPIANSIAADYTSGTFTDPANKTMFDMVLWLLAPGNASCAGADIPAIKTLAQAAVAANDPVARGALAPGALVPGDKEGITDSRGAYLLPFEK